MRPQWFGVAMFVSNLLRDREGMGEGGVKVAHKTTFQLKVSKC